MWKWIIRIIFISLAFAIYGCGSSSSVEERFYYTDSSNEKVISVLNPSVFTFGIVGDIHGNIELLKKIIDKFNTNSDSFLILLGDLTDHGTKEEMTGIKNCLIENGWDTKTYFVIGNHDVYGEGWSYFKTIFGPSHYVFSVGNSAFIVLDTADATLGERGLEWFKNTLQSLTTTNIFVVSHVMPVVPNIITYLKMSNEREALRLMKLASLYNVKAWLGAHYHSYVNYRIASVDYVVAGGGGRRMPPVKSNFYVRIIVNNDSISYKLELVE